jgi:hypothetical protein
MTVSEIEEYLGKRIMTFYRNELRYFTAVPTIDHDKVVDWVSHFIAADQSLENNDQDDDGA